MKSEKRDEVHKSNVNKINIENAINTNLLQAQVCLNFVAFGNTCLPFRDLPQLSKNSQSFALSI